MMIGRWSGAVGAFNLQGMTLKIAKFIAPYLAFGVFLTVNAIAQHDRLLSKFILLLSLL